MASLSRTKQLGDVLLHPRISVVIIRQLQTSKQSASSDNIVLNMHFNAAGRGMK